VSSNTAAGDTEFDFWLKPLRWLESWLGMQ
jgi:hypothetical protein